MPHFGPPAPDSDFDLRSRTLPVRRCIQGTTVIGQGSDVRGPASASCPRPRASFSSFNQRENLRPALLGGTGVVGPYPKLLPQAG